MVEARWSPDGDRRRALVRSGLLLSLIGPSIDSTRRTADWEGGGCETGGSCRLIRVVDRIKPGGGFAELVETQARY